MKVINVNLTMAGTWESPFSKSTLMGFQLRNPLGNGDVSFRWSATGEVLTLSAGEDYEVISPMPETETVDVSEFQISGVPGESLVGEAWIYNYQE